MARTAKPCKSEWLKSLKDNAKVETWQSYSCKLVTPMYGGGVEAGEVDAEMPIRASEIRGQLRFWWRIACCDASLSSQEMFKREVEIWGGIGSTGDKKEVQAKASKVEVRVICPKVTARHFKPSTSESDPGIKYAFGSAAINGVAEWLTDYEFTLQLRFPESVGDEVMAALRWWASFGGVGARTRRGFGAVNLEKLEAVTTTELKNAGCLIANMQKDNKKNEFTALTAWRTANQQLHTFRQKQEKKVVWPVQERMASPVIVKPCFVNGNWFATALLLPSWQEALRQSAIPKENNPLSAFMDFFEKGV